MRRGLANSPQDGYGLVQAVVLALWLLCAFAAGAAPAKKPVKGHAVRARAAVTKPAAKRPQSGKAKPETKVHRKAAPKAKARGHKPKVDDTDFEPPVMQRTRGLAVAKNPARVAVAKNVPVVPRPVKTLSKGYVATSVVSAEPPLPSAYSPVGDDDAPEVADTAPVMAAPTSPLLSNRATRSQLADEAVQPVVLPGLYSRTGRLVVPAALKGSREVLVHQNLMADEAGLDRIQDDDDLARLRRLHLLVDFPVSASLKVNPELNEERRCARPWTVKFAADTARAFHARFGVPLQVNSAVRTVAYQLRLQRTNGNAAAVDGEAASPHLTGQAIDFGKRGMSVAEIAWMRAYLKPMMLAGKVDVEEEFQQACFHISVYRNYLPRAMPKREVAQTHTMVAAMMRVQRVP